MTINPQYFRIFSKTNRIKAEVRLNETLRFRLFDDDVPAETKTALRRVLMVLSAISWARKTGRLHASAEMMLREITGYQFAKMVCRLANSPTIKVDQDVVSYLRGGFPIEGR